MPPAQYSAREFSGFSAFLNSVSRKGFFKAKKDEPTAFVSAAAFAAKKGEYLQLGKGCAVVKDFKIDGNARAFLGAQNSCIYQIPDIKPEIFIVEGVACRKVGGFFSRDNNYEKIDDKSLDKDFIKNKLFEKVVDICFLAVQNPDIQGGAKYDLEEEIINVHDLKGGYQNFMAEFASKIIDFVAKEIKEKGVRLSVFKRAFLGVFNINIVQIATFAPKIVDLAMEKNSPELLDDLLVAVRGNIDDDLVKKILLSKNEALISVLNKEEFGLQEVVEYCAKRIEGRVRSVSFGKDQVRMMSPQISSDDERASAAASPEPGAEGNSGAKGGSVAVARAAFMEGDSGGVAAVSRPIPIAAPDEMQRVAGIGSVVDLDDIVFGSYDPLLSGSFSEDVVMGGSSPGSSAFGVGKVGGRNLAGSGLKNVEAPLVATPSSSPKDSSAQASQAQVSQEGRGRSGSQGSVISLGSGTSILSDFV